MDSMLSLGLFDPGQQDEEPVDEDNDMFVSASELLDKKPKLKFKKSKGPPRSATSADLKKDGQVNLLSIRFYF